MRFLQALGQIRPEQVLKALEVIVALVTIVLDVLVVIREAARKYQE